MPVLALLSESLNFRFAVVSIINEDTSEEQEASDLLSLYAEPSFAAAANAK